MGSKMKLIFVIQLVIIISFILAKYDKNIDHDIIEARVKNHMTFTSYSECRHDKQVNFIVYYKLRQEYTNLTDQEIFDRMANTHLRGSSYGIKHSRIVGDLKNTVELSSRLVRLPMWVGLENVQEQIIEVALKYLKS
jgi:dTDP-4-amino-4,6-dideoxygalactose transaminase